jgi:hypothetical protein
MKKIVLSRMFAAILVFVSWFSGIEKGFAADPDVEQKLIGKHMFSSQNVSWKKLGTAEISREGEELYIKARQAAKETGPEEDYVTLSGTLTIVDAREFIVNGELVTKVSHVYDGKPCARSGTFNFKATGKRKYWRLQQMDNPCDPSLVDYVDVFF